MNIFEQLTKILEVYLTPKNIDEEMKILEISGRITQRKMNEVIILLCKKIDQIENGQKTLV